MRDLNAVVADVAELKLEIGRRRAAAVK
jgi:hypothetical protein